MLDITYEHGRRRRRGKREEEPQALLKKEEEEEEIEMREKRFASSRSPFYIMLGAVRCSSDPQCAQEKTTRKFFHFLDEEVHS